MKAAALDGAPPNTLRLTLHPAGPGVYPGKVVLVSDGDVRLLDVEFVAVRTSQEVTLEFINPARDKLLQEVGRLSMQRFQALMLCSLHWCYTHHMHLICMSKNCLAHGTCNPCL